MDSSGIRITVLFADAMDFQPENHVHPMPTVNYQMANALKICAVTRQCPIIYPKSASSLINVQKRKFALHNDAKLIQAVVATLLVKVAFFLSNALKALETAMQ